jgi:cytochrome P450
VYYPFGGGAHVCIGLHFARMQVKAVMSELLGRFRLRDSRRLRGARAFASVPIPFPRDGLPVVLDAL